MSQMNGTQHMPDAEPPALGQRISNLEDIYRSESAAIKRHYQDIGAWDKFCDPEAKNSAALPTIDQDRATSIAYESVVANLERIFRSQGDKRIVEAALAKLDAYVAERPQELAAGLRESFGSRYEGDPALFEENLTQMMDLPKLLQQIRAELPVLSSKRPGAAAAAGM